MNKQNNIRLMYLRNARRAPQGLIALQVNRDSNIAYYQLSVLNPVDNFSRPLARDIAVGRLVQEPRSVKVAKNANMHQISEAIMRDISLDKKAPSRARKSANLWLEFRARCKKLGVEKLTGKSNRFANFDVFDNSF